jgi:hypothetical protein
MECLGLHNKPKAEVHPVHKLTDSKEEEEFADSTCDRMLFLNVLQIYYLDDMQLKTILINDN